ncbi:MAG: hypothetical protein KKH34_02290 [Candidatus Omnitrophica bacterium]|nr:hypothetical protein [Candidatus Omnitrophota bacterium]MCG2711131.1 hypothetical protein [Candidatus Omnitrophota bacterium]
MMKIKSNSRQKIMNLLVGAGIIIFSAAINVYAANQMSADSYLFTVIDDNTPPVIDRCLPAAAGANVSRSSNIKFSITDDFSGVDSSTINISVGTTPIVVDGVIRTYVNGQGDTVEYDVKIVEKSAKEYVVVYDRVEYFNYEENVTVSVSASDVRGNAMGTSSYLFKVQNFVHGSVKSLSGKRNASSVLVEQEQDNSCVVVSDNGKNVYIVWEEVVSGYWDIYCAESADFGESFLNVIKVNGNEDNVDHRYPDAAIDASGNVYVVWQQRSGVNDWDIYVARLESGAAGFASARLIYNDSGASNQTRPSIAVGPALTDDGDSDTVEPATVYVCWLDDKAGIDMVYYTRTTADYADEWDEFVGMALRIDDDRWPQLCADPRIRLDDSGRIFAAWRGQNQDSTSSIYFDTAAATSVDAGENFGVDTIVSDGTANGKGPDLEVSQTGSIVYVLCKKLTGTEANLLLYCYNYNQGLGVYELDGSYQVNDAALSADTLLEYALKINNNNDVFVAWSGKQGDSCVINLAGALHTDYQFEDYTQFATGGQQFRPALATDIEGNHFFVTWTDDRNLQNEVCFCRNTFITTDEIISEGVDSNTGGQVNVSSGDISGAGIDVSADAMETPLQITIAEVVAPPADAADMSSVGPVVDFGPGGTIFNSNVTISLPYSELSVTDAGINEASLKVYYYNLSASAWELVSGAVVDPARNVVSVATNHFSMYVVAGTAELGDDSPPDDIVPPASVSSSSSSSGGCFIATAAFGTKMAKEVRSLCEFRDRYLLKNTFGSAFVRFYYRNSPPIADYIAKKERLKRVIRACLRPLIIFSRAICG